jgi:peptidoglycan/LPS O-acetylase OafA/YrhL
VLSGLCIHLPHARKLSADPTTRLELRSYFRRRFTRIYHPHLIVLIISAAAALALPLNTLNTNLLLRPTLWQFVAHIFMVHSLVPGAIFSINGVLWTIALETQFYVLYPVVLIARRRHSALSICFALLLLSVCARMLALLFLPEKFWILVDQSGLRRYWEWVLGLYLAERLVASGRVGFRSPLLGPLILLASFLLGIFVVALPLGGAIRTYAWPITFAIAIAMFAQQRTSESNLVERAGAWLGLASYSLYLTHPIVIVALMITMIQAGISETWVREVVCLVAGLVVSALYFYAVERPFMLRASKTGRH